MIVACSQRKRIDDGLLPAIERYDGGNFRVLRKAKREGVWTNAIDVLILSAKYGLIDADTLIANYEQRMNRSRAIAMKEQVTQTLKKYAVQRAYSEIYLELGQDYYVALEEITEIYSVSKVIHSRGRIGERLRNLKCWLFEKSRKN